MDDAFRVCGVQVKAERDESGDAILSASFGEQGDVGASTGPMTFAETAAAVVMLEAALEVLREPVTV